MITVVVWALVLVVCVWWYARRRRAATLAGRNVEKPTYTVEAPGRRLRPGSKDVL